MDGFLFIIVVLMYLIGMAGCFIPGVFGPPLVALGSIFLVFGVGNGTDTVGWVLIISLAVISILDFVLPSIGVKKWGGTKMGMVGAFIGMFVGFFMPIPLGSILGCFLGAVLFEKIEGMDWDKSFKAGAGAMLMLAVSTFLKIIICAGSIIYFLTTVFNN